MRRLKVVTVIIVALAGVAALACAEPVPDPQPTSTGAAIQPPAPGPVPSPQPAVSLFPYSVTDSNGNEVTFEKPPERIVAFDSAVVETLFAIGEGSRVVGTHEFVSYPPETQDIPRVGDAFNMNVEAIVALEPDLVFVFSEGAVADLERVGLRVLYQKSLDHDFRRVADNIRTWGHITGSPDAAEIVAARFEARVARIEEAVASQVGGTGAFQDEGQLWTPGPDTLMGEVLALLKLANIAHDVSGYAQLSPEIIVERNPAIIIASYGDTISDNPAFSRVQAVISGRIYVPQSDALSVAGPRFVDGIEELATWVYPGLFE